MNTCVLKLRGTSVAADCVCGSGLRWTRSTRSRRAFRHFARRGEEFIAKKILHLSRERLLLVNGCLDHLEHSGFIVDDHPAVLLGSRTELVDFPGAPVRIEIARR